MSAKRQLAETIAALPESVSMEEAVETIYRILKLKQALQRHGRPGPGASETAGDLALIQDIARHCAALPDFDLRTPDEILGYDEKGMF